MFCESCGKQMPDGTKFCADCGAKVEIIESTAEPVHSPPPLAATVPPPPTPPPSTPPSTPPPVHQYNTSQSQNTSPGQQTRVGVPPLSVGQYLGMILITAIPILGIIMLFVWGFGNEQNTNRKNLAKAYLIIMLIAIVLSIISSVAIVGIISSLAGSINEFM